MDDGFLLMYSWNISTFSLKELTVFFSIFTFSRRTTSCFDYLSIDEKIFQTTHDEIWRPSQWNLHWIFRISNRLWWSLSFIRLIKQSLPSTDSSYSIVSQSRRCEQIDLRWILYDNVTRSNNQNSNLFLIFSSGFNRISNETIFFSFFSSDEFINFEKYGFILPTQSPLEHFNSQIANPISIPSPKTNKLRTWSMIQTGSFFDIRRSM